MTEDLTWRQRHAVASLCGGATVTDAADDAGVTRQTLHQWLNQDAVQRALKDAECDALDALSRRLVGLADLAAGVFADVLQDSDASPTVRIRAANMLLQRLIQIRELYEFESRLVELERQVLD